MPIRFRFTVRGVMVGVAIAAVAILMADSLRRLTKEYVEKADRFRTHAQIVVQGYPTENRERLIAYLESMAKKYEQAARFPWMPLADDPPIPAIDPPELPAGDRD